MAQNRNRYKEMENLLTKALIADGALFVLYLIFAIAGVIWLKVVLAIFAMLIAVAGLALLYLSKELLKQRSLWLSTGFFAVFITLLASLILAFP